MFGVVERHIGFIDKFVFFNGVLGEYRDADTDRHFFERLYLGLVKLCFFNAALDAFGEDKGIFGGRVGRDDGKLLAPVAAHIISFS